MNDGSLNDNGGYVYALCDGVDILYVGSTQDIVRRTIDHFRRNVATGVQYERITELFFCTTKTRDDAYHDEAALISCIKPDGNIAKPSCSTSDIKEVMNANWYSVEISDLFEQNEYGMLTEMRVPTAVGNVFTDSIKKGPSDKACTTIRKRCEETMFAKKRQSMSDKKAVDVIRELIKLAEQKEEEARAIRGTISVLEGCLL